MTRTQAASGPHPHATVRTGVPLGAITALACVAQFMVVLDTSIVNVALPSMRAELHLSTTAQQWVVTGYLITFGGLVLAAARSGDLFGRKPVFLVGLSLFTLASLVGGLATTGATLLAARAVQGVGAAALAPTSLSLITAGHYDAARRAKALSWWSAAASSAGAAGMVAGGILTSGLTWRWVMIINVPIGVVLFAAAQRLLAPPVGAGAHRVDWAGAATATSAAAALVYAVSTAVTDGWVSPDVLGALAAALLLAGVFLAIQTRAENPMIPLTIFAHRNLAVANATGLLLGVIMTSTFFFLSLYLQQITGYSALRTGMALLPWTLALIAGVMLARRALPAAGPKAVLIVGALATATGLGLLALLPAHPAYLAHVLTPTILSGLGISAMVLPLTITATSDVDPADAGLASGLINSGRQLGGAIGLAVLVTIAATASNTGHETLTLDGYRTAFLLAAAAAALAALSASMIRTSQTPPN
jgi:EmrB/QacA subfamily drug resistance transporter